MSEEAFKSEDARRSSRILGSCTLATAAIIYAVTSGQTGLGALLVLACLLPSVLPRRPAPGAAGQALLSLAVCAVTITLCRLFPVGHEVYGGLLGEVAQPTALSTTLLATTRLALRTPLGSARVSAAIGMLAVVACGSSRPSAAYPMLSLLYLLGASLWLRLDGLSGADPLPSTRRDRLVLAALLAIAGVIAGALSLTLPLAHQQAVKALMSEATPRVGFREGPMDLGSLEGLLQSNTIVARAFDLQGSRLLRGGVFREYQRGRWSSPSSRPHMQPADDSAPSGPVVTLQLQSIETPRFFVPLEAKRVLIDEPALFADPFGVLSPVPGHPALRVRYEPGERPSSLLPLGPEPLDLQLPPDIAPRLRELARTYAPATARGEEALEAIERRLVAEHTYALHFSRPQGIDPVLAFLDERSSGHCEYFSSAMALLARARGIPARVVVGYRVSEWNPLGGYHVVRERNAHAWVEAFIEGRGWVSVDPSPRESLEAAGPATTGALSALLDAAIVLYHEGFERLRPHLLEVTLGLLSLLGLLVWRERRKAQRPETDAQPSADASLACLPPLLSQLASLGLNRPLSEPLEAFAARIASQAPEASLLLQRYAALRYGRSGDAKELSVAIERYLEQARVVDQRVRGGGVAN